MTAVILFLGRVWRRLQEGERRRGDVIVAMDSEACFDEIEMAWRAADVEALEAQGRNMQLETICELRRRIYEHGGRGMHVRFVWVPAHVGIICNQMADAVAKAFLYDAPQEPRMHTQRGLVVYALRELRTGHAYALPADRKQFRLVRRLLAQWAARRRAGVQLPRDPPLPKAAQVPSAAASATLAWPLIDRVGIGALPRPSEPRRWSALLKMVRLGAGVTPGHKRAPTTAGMQSLLCTRGVLLHRKRCPLCEMPLAAGWVDVRHVLCGECTASEAASATERQQLADGLRELLDTFEGARAEVQTADGRETALRDEIEEAAAVFESAVDRTAAGEATWRRAARVASGNLPTPGKRAREQMAGGRRSGGEASGKAGDKAREAARRKVMRVAVRQLTEWAAAARGVVGRWMQAAWEEEQTATAATRKRRAEEPGEYDEAYAVDVHRGRGARAARRETVREERQREVAMRVASERRPRMTRVCLGPVAVERYIRPHAWWEEEQRQRRAAAFQGRVTALQQRLDDWAATRAEQRKAAEKAAAEELEGAKARANAQLDAVELVREMAAYEAAEQAAARDAQRAAEAAESNEARAAEVEMRVHGMRMAAVAASMEGGAERLQRVSSGASHDERRRQREAAAEARTAEAEARRHEEAAMAARERMETEAAAAAAAAAAVAAGRTQMEMAAAQAAAEAAATRVREQMAAEAAAAEAAAMVAEAATQGEAAAAEEATQAEAAAAAEATQAEAVQAEGGAVASEGAGAAPPRGKNKGKRKGHDARHAEAKRQRQREAASASQDG